MTTNKSNKVKEIKLKINSYDDRRELASILAENGYMVRIKKEEDYLTTTYFVIINL